MAEKIILDKLFPKGHPLYPDGARKLVTRDDADPPGVVNETLTTPWPPVAAEPGE